MYNRFAENYNRIFQMEQSETSYLIKLIKETGAKNILELGCGTGLLISSLSSYIDLYTGVDFDSGMLDIAASIADDKVKLVNKDMVEFVKECEEVYDWPYYPWP